jgi:hypothetical protein
MEAKWRLRRFDLGITKEEVEDKFAPGERIEELGSQSDRNMQVLSQTRECEACEGLSWNVKSAFIVVCVAFEKGPTPFILSSAQSLLLDCVLE